MDENIDDLALRAWLEPRRASLMIVDMQADFVSPEGAAADSGADLAAVLPALAAAERLARVARQAEVLVTFVGLETSEATDSPVWLERLARLGKNPEVEMALCRRGSRGAGFLGAIPGDGDLVVMKPRYSGFFQTELLNTLRRRGVDTLVVCGVTTECCVDATVRDAFHADFHVFVVADACGSYDQGLHGATLKSLGRNFAILVGAGQVERAWSMS